jgi:outer membrane protein assembly complex protein YaeT
MILLNQKFPQLLNDPEPGLSEIDEAVRFLMATGVFANIEVVRATSANGTELILVASAQRRVHSVEVSGNKIFTASEVREKLRVQAGQAFERKNLLAAADELREEYRQQGFQNPLIQINFELNPDDTVIIKVDLKEGPSTQVTSIEFETPNSLLKTKLERNARRFLGRALSEDFRNELQKATLAHLQSLRYITARLSQPNLVTNSDRSQVRLIYSVENPWRYEFVFDGNRFFSDRTLMAALSLESYSGASSPPLPDFIDKVTRHYSKSGFANAMVTAEARNSRQLYRTVVRVTISEGDRVRIRDIQFTGNISRPSTYYGELLRRLGVRTVRDGFLYPPDLNDSLDQVIIELQNQGYLRARKLPFRIEPAPELGGVRVLANLDEGPLTQIRQIRFEGAEAFSPSRLQEVITLRPGLPLSYKDIQLSIQQLNDLYRNQGHLEMRITNLRDDSGGLVTFNEGNTQASIEFRIEEGPKVRVAAISIEGFSQTQESVISREIAFKVGDVLTPELIDETIFRLQKLDLFSQVSLRTLEEGTSIGERTVLIAVSERNPGTVSIGVGVNNERNLTFRGFLGVSYRNLGGTGRAVSVRFDPRYSLTSDIDYVEYKLSGSYLQPYLFGSANKARIVLAREEFATNERGSNNAVLIQEKVNLDLLLERDLSRQIKLTFTALSFANLQRVNRVTRSIEESLNIGKFGPQIDYDTRDFQLNPTQGQLTSIGLEFADPWLGSSVDQTQQIRFLKLIGRTTHYFRPLTRPDVVWANSLQGGHLRNLGELPQSGVPLQETFSLGGPTTIRGFDQARAIERIPNSFQLGRSPLTRFRVTTESSYFLIKTELRFPLFQAGGIPIGGVVFYDGGAVLLNEPGTDLQDPYRHSVGFGLRPLFGGIPVVLDVGFKINPRSYSDGSREEFAALHLSITNF